MSQQDFTPEFYLSLRRRRSNVVLNCVDYDLSYDGIDNPKCIIVPVCRHVTKTMDGNQFTRYYMCYDNEWVEVTIVEERGDLITLRVPIGAKSIKHELSTT